MPPEPASEGLRGAAERSWPEVGMPGDGDPLAEPAALEARRGIRLGSKAADGGRVKCLPIPEPHRETPRAPRVKHFRLYHLHTHATSEAAPARLPCPAPTARRSFCTGREAQALALRILVVSVQLRERARNAQVGRRRKLSQHLRSKWGHCQCSTRRHATRFGCR